MIWTVVTYGVLLVVNVVVLGLVPERRRPSSAMAWLLLIFFLPGIGLLLFLLLGSPFVPFVSSFVSLMLCCSGLLCVCGGCFMFC